jgi:hypothetical protein
MDVYFPLKLDFIVIELMLKFKLFDILIILLIALQHEMA